jgi:mannose-6-phosphate isomerase
VPDTEKSVATRYKNCMQTDRRLAPLPLEPKLSPAIWGGSALVERYGKHGDPSFALGESWECYDANAIASGPFEGTTLATLRTELGAALMGPLDATARFPILTKIIDARDNLSVQVHPDDAYARRVEHQPNGKTECWYILDAAPGAELVLGWNRDTDRAEYERRVADGTLGELLRRVPVKPGDAFYLPAGTLHAIGAGIVLFETQQTSDITYRIFDWNRVDAQGNGRELHVAKAADVLDFRESIADAVHHLTFADGGLERTVCIADARFTVERLDVGETGASLDLAGLPATLTALERPVVLAVGGDESTVAPYTSVVLPAALGRVGLAPHTAGTTQALLATPALPAAVLRDRAVAAGISAGRIATFLAQFGVTV